MICAVQNESMAQVDGCACAGLDEIHAKDMHACAGRPEADRILWGAWHGANTDGLARTRLNLRFGHGQMNGRIETRLRRRLD